MLKSFLLRKKISISTLHISENCGCAKVKYVGVPYTLTLNTTSTLSDRKSTIKLNSLTRRLRVVVGLVEKLNKNGLIT